MLFSATVNINQKQLRLISDKLNVVKVAEDFVIPEKLDCWYIQVPIEQKIYYLARYLCQNKQKIVVFTLTCNFSRYLHFVLSNVLANELKEQNRQIFYLYGK